MFGSELSGIAANAGGSAPERSKPSIQRRSRSQRGGTICDVQVAKSPPDAGPKRANRHQGPFAAARFVGCGSTVSLTHTDSKWSGPP